MLLAFAPGTDLSALWKAYIHGYYRRHPNGQQVWVDSYSDKRPEKHRTEFAHWQHRIEHFKDHLSQGHTREALHAFHDLGHDDSHKLARDLGLHDDGPEFADKKTLMGAVHGRILARKQELQAKVGAQVKADFEKRKAAGTVGKKVGKARAKDTVTMSKQELIAEHEKLVAVLKSPDHADDLKEAKEQEQELKGYKGQAGGAAKAAKPKATPADATDISPAEAAEAERQYQEVKARYQGTPGWMKAPNGKPSKLNERQWVLSRTTNFRRWFGNWGYNPNDTVQVVKVEPGAMAGINLEDTDAVRTWLLGAADFAEPVLNADSGLAIGFSRGNLRASLKRRGGAHRQAYTALRSIIETARWTDYETSDRPGLAGQDVYHGALRMPNGALYGVRIKTDVRHDRSMAYKDHRLSEMVAQIQITPAASQGSREGIGYPGSTGPAQSGVTVSLGDVYGSGKPTTSAMVDASGEPLIAYHGTGADISGFDDQGKSTQGEGLGTGLGHFFTNSPEYASDYAKMAQGNVIPSWLAIKQPLVIPDREGMSAAFRIASDAYGQQHYGKTLYELENSEDDADYRTVKAFYDQHLGATDEGYFGRKNRFVRQQLQAMGYDGIVFKNDRQLGAEGGEVLVAFTAPQVKSAIGNAGTFRPDLAHLSKAWPRTPIFFRNARIH